MKTIKQISRVMFLALAVAICCGALVGIAGEVNGVPSDFRLFAQYGPGWGPGPPWKVMITANGKVSQDIDVLSSGGWTVTHKAFALSRKQLQQLVTVVRQANFFSLARRYSYPVTDNPTLILNVTMDGKTSRVVVYAPHHLQGNAGVQRFLKVWNLMVKMVPPPNLEQRPK